MKFTRPLLFFAGSAGGCALRRSSSSSARRRARRSSLRRISSLSARAYRPCICFLKLLSLAEQAQTVQHMRTVRRWSNKVTSEDSIPHLSTLSGTLKAVVHLQSNSSYVCYQIYSGPTSNIHSLHRKTCTVRKVYQDWAYRDVFQIICNISMQTCCSIVELVLLPM